MKQYCKHNNLIHELYDMKQILWYQSRKYDAWSYSVMTELYGVLELQKSKAFNTKKKKQYEI